jgi:hypothetical protein
MLTYLEDFIEYIGGVKDATGRLTNYTQPVVRLANYDVGIVNSLSMQTSTGTPFTDRQCQLATKIVIKYRKQLAVNGIVLPEHLPLRMPIREVDRSSYMTLSEDRKDLYLRFPYSTTLIDSIRQFGYLSCGRVEFNREKRQWEIGVSVPNLVYMLQWAEKHEFEIRFDSDQLLNELYQDYCIPTLKFDADQNIFALDGNYSSIDLDQLNQLPNFLQVLTLVSQWQINVDDSVIQQARRHGHSEQAIQWSMKRLIHVRPNDVDLQDFFAWVNTTDLWPVIWHSQQDSDIDYLKNHIGQDRVVHFTGRRSLSRRDPCKEKLVLFTTALTQKNMDKAGVLITRESILYQIKHHWSHKADKIVYWGDKILSEVIT